jgi:hypothetical protein
MTLRAERNLRVFENRMLRRIVEPKRDELIGGWRKLHNEEFHDLYWLPSVIIVINSRKVKWTGYVAHMGEKRNVCRMLT